jgi:hypothetical protein
MATLCGDSHLGVTFAVVSHAGRFTRLRINQLNIGNVDESFLINDSATTVRLWIRLLMPLNHSHTFDFDFALCWSNFKHATTSSLITARDYHNLIVLLYFRPLCSWHARNNLSSYDRLFSLSDARQADSLSYTLDNLRRE